MMSERELLREIETLEDAPTSYQNCERLASLYVLRDHLYPAVAISKMETPVPAAGVKAEPVENIIREDGSSEFMVCVNGKCYADVLPVMDELMETLKMVNPRVYDGVMRKIR